MCTKTGRNNGMIIDSSNDCRQSYGMCTETGYPKRNRRVWDMKTMIKRIAAMGTAGLCLMNLAACGQKTAGESQGSQTAGTEASAETKGAEVSWYSTVPGFGPDNWNVSSSPALDYMRDTIGLTVKLEQPPTDADTKLGLMIASNDLPDVISVTDRDTMHELIDSGQIWDMESFLKEYDPESHLLKDFPEDVKKAHIDAFGGWYAYPSDMLSDDDRKVFPPADPFYVEQVNLTNNCCIMFDENVMDAVGITADEVKTEEDFYKACEKVAQSDVTINGQKIIPVILHGDEWIEKSLDTVIANNFGAQPVDENSHYRHLELSPGYKEALKFVNNLVQKGCLDVNTMTIDDTALKTYLKAGVVFCWIGNQQLLDKTGTRWASFGPVLASSGAQPAEPINQSAGLGWIWTAVSKNCREPEKVAKWLSWITSREGLLMNYYGIEGRDYTIDEGGFVTRTEEGEKTWLEDYKKNQQLWPFTNLAFNFNTEPVPEPDSDFGLAERIATAIGRYENTYIYDSALLDFTSANVVEPSSDLGIAKSQIDSYLESQKAKIISAPDDASFEAEYQNMLTTLDSYHVADIDAEYDKVLQKRYQETGKTIKNHNAELYR